MSTRRFDEATRRFEPFSHGTREYPVLTQALRNQLRGVPATGDGAIRYYPCEVVLVDGTVQDCVYVVESSEYIRTWGVWPGQDLGKKEIRLVDVTEIRKSPTSLPQEMAKRLYTAGESGMGYVVFEVSYLDGSRSRHLAGNAVDFVQLAPGKTTSDIANVHPHAGRGSKEYLKNPDYYWCLFEEKK